MIRKINADEKQLIKNIKCFALDMDGTIYLGERWIEGAQDFLKAVEKSGLVRAFYDFLGCRGNGCFYLGMNCLWRSLHRRGSAWMTGHRKWW